MTGSSFSADSRDAERATSITNTWRFIKVSTRGLIKYKLYACESMFSYQCEMPPQQGRQTLALEISSSLICWSLGDFGFLSKLCVVLLSLCSLLYYQLHHMSCMDRQLWYHCPTLPERTAVWHITTQTCRYSGSQCHPLLASQSHAPSFRMLLRLFD